MSSPWLADSRWSAIGYSDSLNTNVCIHLRACIYFVYFKQFPSEVANACAELCTSPTAGCAMKTFSPIRPDTYMCSTYVYVTLCVCAVSGASSLKHGMASISQSKTTLG